MIESIVWAVLSLIIPGVIVVKIRKYRFQRALMIPRSSPRYSDDAIKQAKEIASFLCRRREEAGVLIYECADGSGIPDECAARVASGRDDGVITLIRLCHYLGCELVVRQIGYDDLENAENTPQVFAEYIAKLDEQN